MMILPSSVLSATMRVTGLRILIRERFPNLAAAEDAPHLVPAQWSIFIVLKSYFDRSAQEDSSSMTLSGLQPTTLRGRRLRPDGGTRWATASLRRHICT